MAEKTSRSERKPETGQRLERETSGKQRAKRDPEGRRRAIVEAAALIIGREGTRKLTHRRVAEKAGVPLGSTTQYFSGIDELRHAALEEIARLIELDYDEMFHEIDEQGGTPEAFAQAINAYLADTAQIDADTAFYAAAVNDPAMRPLARASFQLAVERSLPYLDEQRATALAMLLDGAMLDTCLAGAPVDPTVIDLAVAAIFGTKPDPGNPGSGPKSRGDLTRIQPPRRPNAPQG